MTAIATKLSSRGIPIVGMSRRQLVFWGGLVAILALTLGLNEVGVSPYLVLPVAAVAILWVATALSQATSMLQAHKSDNITGLVQSTIGNAPEAFSVFFLLQAGLNRLAMASLVGSVVVNALLMLGGVYLAGSIKQGGVMKFRPALGMETVKMTALVVMVVGFFAIAHNAHYISNGQEDQLSLIMALLILPCYILMIMIHGKKGKGESSLDLESAWSFRTTMITMIVGGVGAALAADVLVGSLEPVMKSLHLSEDFVGFVFVAIIGNASENLGAFKMALKGENDLAVGMIKHSVAQVAAGLLPLMIVLSWLTSSHLSFAMPVVYIAALLMAPVAIYLTSEDGEAEPHEGAMLIILYVLMGASMLVH